MRRGHADSLASVGVNPDGSRFVSGGWDGAIHVWRTGTRLTCRQLHLLARQLHLLVRSCAVDKMTMCASQFDSHRLIKLRVGTMCHSHGGSGAEQEASRGGDISAARATGMTGRSEVEAAEEAQASGAADDAAGSRKRRAKSSGGAADAAGGGSNGGAPTAEQLKGAVQSPSQALLAGHTQCVAAVVWPTARTAVSGSWDHSVSEFGGNPICIIHRQLHQCRHCVDYRHRFYLSLSDSLTTNSAAMARGRDVTVMKSCTHVRRCAGGMCKPASRRTR